MTKYGAKKSSVETLTNNAFYGCEYGPTVDRITEVRLSREEVIRRLKRLERLENKK